MSHRILALEFIGRKFGRLTVEAELEPDQHKKVHWLCRCDCGGTSTPSTRALITGNSKSCGCARRNAIGASRRTHGRSRTPEYRNWCAMKERCYSPAHKNYDLYGGRGIRVCDRWVDSFENFLADMGERPFPRATVERIDTDGHYAPGNCKWETQKEQCRNKRNNHNLTVDGETLTISQWSERHGVGQRQIRKRITELGWTASDAVKLPPQTKWNRRPPKK
jgi:hypothetical protein